MDSETINQSDAALLCDAAQNNASQNAKKFLRFSLFLAMWNRREGLVSPRVHFKIAQYLESQLI